MSSIMRINVKFANLYLANLTLYKNHNIESFIMLAVFEHIFILQIKNNFISIIGFSVHKA